MDADFRVDQAKAARVAKSLNDSQFKLFREVRSAFAQTMNLFESQLITERLSGRPGLNRITGQLVGSFGHIVQGTTLPTLSGFFFTTSKYARVHELGGTITANGSMSRTGTGKYLAIPLDRTAAGAARNPFPDAIPGLFVVKSKAGNLLLAKKSPDGKGIMPMFVLKKSVYIPPRLGFFDTFFGPVNQERIYRLMAKAIGKGING